MKGEKGKKIVVICGLQAAEARFYVETWLTLSVQGK
jgi:hypothetical protein